MKKAFFIPVFLYLSTLINCTAQNIDSLWKVYSNKNQADTIRLQAIQKIAWSYVFNNPDTAFVLAQQELQFAQDKQQKKWQAKAFNIMGVSFLNKSNYPKALKYYLQSLKICKELNNKQGIASSLNNIGLVYFSLSDYPKALDNQLQGLKINEELHDKKAMAGSLSNIGNIYSNLSDYDKSLDYQLQSLKIREEIGDKKGTANSLGNIGGDYEKLLDYNKALDYYLRSVKIEEEINNRQGVASTLGNIGTIYADLSDYPKALDYQLQSLKIREEIGDKNGIATSLNNLAMVYFKQKKYALSLEYSLKSVELAKEIGNLDLEKNFENNLHQAYKIIGNSTQALLHYERYVLLKDSIDKEENRKQIMRKELNYEFEKKEAIIKLEQEKKDVIYIEKSKQQRLIIYTVIGGLLLVVIFSLILYKRFRLTNEQKQIIEIKNKETETQKRLIEEKQKEIIDSISYAKRLQQAILPANTTIKKYLPNSFIFYQPKDIVAGDFYWMEHLDNITYIAAADSTGHGVPGAMVSVVCSNALNRAVKEFGLRDTGKILDKTRELVLETFEKSGEEIKDGMDISLLAINQNTHDFLWSGANNPLWYFLDNELIEIKADKQPIGKSDNPKPFPLHAFKLNNKGGVIYLFTDGFADQFGGTKGKKFKYNQLKNLLSEIQNISAEKQFVVLKDEFKKWKGSLEQTDDITIIGLKV